MPRPEIDGFPTPSLVDRLSSEEPDFAAGFRQDESGQVRHPVNKARSREAAKHYEETVRRDLEWLFNTRRIKDDRLVRYPHVQNSVFCYGLADINSEDPSRVHDRDELLRNMEDALTRFDPRLRDFNVEFAPQISGSHLLHFQITGVVIMDPAPAEVSFETSLDPSNGECKVK